MVVNEAFILMASLFGLEFFEAESLWSVLMLFVDTEKKSSFGGKLRPSYSNCTSHILLYPSAFLCVPSTDRHTSLKSMMPIRVRLVQLLNVEKALSLDRRHLARKSCSENGIRPGWSSCLGGLRCRSKPVVFSA
jgi:hypothetical protein